MIMPFKDPEVERQYRKEYYKKNKERIEKVNKAWFKKNEEKMKEYKKKWGRENKERKSRMDKERYQIHKELYKQKAKKQRETENPEKVKERRKKWYSKTIKSNIQFKIQARLRSRLYQALKGNYKNGSAVSAIGCTIEELKIHLENQFEEGMTWENWKFYGWHMDHIKPLCSFDLTDPVQFKQAWHYTNLQPLWWKENLKKGKSTE